MRTAIPADFSLDITGVCLVGSAHSFTRRTEGAQVSASRVVFP
jgi:hypothetical protein